MCKEITHIDDLVSLDTHFDTQTGFYAEGRLHSVLMDSLVSFRFISFILSFFKFVERVIMWLCASNVVVGVVLYMESDRQNELFFKYTEKQVRKILMCAL